MGDICFSGFRELITFVEQNQILYARSTDIFNGAGSIIRLLVLSIYS